jgi:membrane protein involved in colicin uptake
MEAVIIVAVVLALVFVGYLVWTKNKSKTPPGGTGSGDIGGDGPGAQV